MPIINKGGRKAWQGERKAFQRKKKKHDNYKIYNGRRWRKLRVLILQDSPLCVDCQKKGYVVEAEVVDHIKPINQGGAVYSESNLQTLCHKCHNSKSGKEAHG